MRTFEYWQAFSPAPDPKPEVWHESYAAPMRDGRALLLPMRDYGATAQVGLIVNQASVAVLDALVEWMAADVQHVGAELVVGLPTLGNTPGAGVARMLVTRIGSRPARPASSGMTSRLRWPPAR